MWFYEEYEIYPALVYKPIHIKIWIFVIVKIYHLVIKLLWSVAEHIALTKEIMSNKIINAMKFIYLMFYVFSMYYLLVREMEMENFQNIRSLKYCSTHTDARMWKWFFMLFKIFHTINVNKVQTKDV